MRAGAHGLRSIAIIIPNWNSGAHLRRCLVAIAQARAQSVTQVVVIDNASSDGSAEVLDLARPLPLRVIRNRTNFGFAAAANQGAALCTEADLLFMNPDIVVDSGTIDCAAAALVGGSAENPPASIVGVRLTDEAGRTRGSTSPFPTPGRLLAQACGLHIVCDRLSRFDPMAEHETTRVVDQIIGAFLLVRRDVFDALGGFDERFFVYYEDVDLCLRARQQGHRCRYHAMVKAEHAGQGCTRRIEDVRLFHLLRSRLLYADKHFGRAGRIVVRLATLAIEPVARAAGLIARGTPHKLPLLARAYAMLHMHDRRACGALRRRFRDREPLR